MFAPAPRRTVRVGSTVVTYLPDGEARLVPEAVFPTSGAGWAVYAACLDADRRLPISIGSFLLETAGRRLLVDLGLGAAEFEVPGMGSFRGGRLLESLADVGLRPEDIDTVVYTHLHHDHVGWTSGLVPAPGVTHTEPAQLTFARATHLVARAEWEHWAGSAEVTGPDPAAVQQPLADVITFFDDGDEIAPGVRTRSTAGHTPGHTSLQITDPSSDGDPSAARLLLLGDVMHTQAQVSETDWQFLFDHDPAQGNRTRAALAEEYADERTVVAGGHFAGDVFGRILPRVRTHRWAAHRW